MPAPFHMFTAVALLALLNGGCATGLRRYDSHDSHGRGARLVLLEDEVQGSGLGTEETAPAGTYVAEFENDNYVFYRGQRILERHNLRHWTARGGIAVAKKERGRAVLYAQDPLSIFLFRPLHAAFAVR